MKCDGARELFSDYLEGTVDYALWETFRGHIEQCSSCRGEFEQVKRTWQALDSLPEIEPPVSFRHDVVMRAARMQHEKSKPRVWIPDVRGLFARLVPTRVVGLAFAGTALALLFMKIGVPIHHFNAGLGSAVQITDNYNGDGVVSGDQDSSLTDNPEMGQKYEWQSRKLGRNTVWVSVEPKETNNGRTLYRVLLSINRNAMLGGQCDRIGAQVNLLPSNEFGGTTAPTSGLVWQGSILSYSPVLVPVIIDHSQGDAESVNLLVTWRYRNRQFSEIVYIPSNTGRFHAKEAYNFDNDVTSYAKNHPDLYSSLQAIAQDYGTIIVANAGMTRRPPVVLVNAHNLSDTLRATLSPWGLDWLPADHAVYVDREYHK